MKVSNLMIRLFTLLMMVITNNSVATMAGCSKWTKLETQTDCVVSTVQLIASPSSYENRRIRLAGVVNFEYERNLLYMDIYSYEERLYENAINLALDVEDIEPLIQVNGELVRIYGKFKKLSDGFYYLTEVSHIKLKDGGLVLFDDSRGKVIPSIIRK
ncbi:hypothetical protein [Pseudoalteromonas sp. PPB1]|uniref:hypothetical protein n=1 Tax=Pseudoalteromonas sp. PPB1 TaxID=2756136 RepID=UPI001890EF4E|nr:hypothetical protein [Pseudoalteromonas sp. PPB1]